MDTKIYVSDLITTDIIEKLEKGKNYLISSEMNSGKNYWVRTVLLPFALKDNKRTLILSHRTQTLQQQTDYLKEFKQECERQFKGGLFTIKSYQAFQKMIQRNDPMLNSFDYIVCDEAHYFVSDSSFNSKTELAFDFINGANNAIKIFMTGTPDALSYLPWSDELEVLKEANYYNNQVKDMYRYESNDVISAVVHKVVENGEKAIVYHNAVETAADFKIGNHKLLYSGNRESSSEFLQIAKQRKFECDVLNTTKLMTEATEIIDDSVKTIVIHGISDIDTFVQATSRVRNQKVNVYYKRISNRSIQAKLRYIEKQLYYYDEYESLGEIEFVKQYGIDVISKSMKAFCLDIVMDPKSFQEYTRLKVHKTALAYLCYQEEIYNFMNEYGFEKFFEKYFPNIQYYDLEQLQKEKMIQLDIINNYVGKKVFEEQKRELINIICTKYKLRSSNGSSKIGRKTINSFFEENNIPYFIDNIKEGKGENRNKMYWILEEIKLEIAQ